MPSHVLAARLAEVTTTTGTGNYVVTAALTGYRRFNARMQIGDFFYGFVEAVDASGLLTGDWEEGLYTYSAENTLTRTTIHASSNNGNAVNWGAGIKWIQMGLTSHLARNLISGSVENGIGVGGGGSGGNPGSGPILPVPTGITSGSTVTLQRGTTYQGTLDLEGLNNVSVVAAGSGALPIVSPGATVSGWTLHSGNIYKATFANFTPVQLTVDASPVHEAHYPTRATRFVTSNAGTDGSHVNFDLPAAADGNMAGAKIHVRIHNSGFQERTVNSYSGNEMTLSSAVDATSEREFYLEGRLWMLTENNSWVYEGGQIYLWCSDGLSPATKNVWATQNVPCIDAGQTDDCTFTNIETVGGSDGILMSECDGNSIISCSMTSAFHNATYFNGSINVTVDGCTVLNSYRDGINGWYGTHNVDVTDCVVTNTGMVGMPKHSHGHIFIGSGSNEVGSPGEGLTNLVARNTCTNAVYHGIQVTRNYNTTVEDNVVDGACMALTDGGGIYTGAPDGIPLNMVIQRNTVKNMFSDEGTHCHGIYLDDSANDVLVDDNVVEDCDACINLHNAFDCTITNNTFLARTAATTNIFSMGGSDGAIHDNVFTDNICRVENPTTWVHRHEYSATFADWCTINNNTYQLDYAEASDRFGRTWDGVGSGIDRNYANWKAFWPGADTTSTYTEI